MRGQIVTEDRFLHQGIDHHLFVSRSEENENEFRFDVRCLPAGTDRHETIYERTVDYSDMLHQCSDNTIDQLIEAELAAIKLKVFADEARHANDP